ncbi:MAG: cell division protein FtsZ [Crocinitomicaceae bacterium]|jgi:cell division protein FtsZ|nr:cell division protein FtsZ [Crocinitomicaceae bacterium]
MEFDLPKDSSSIIKVIGVGGGGSNAVNHMYKEGINGVDFIVCNTDKQALDISPVPFKIQLGPSLTEGRGAGSIPEIGKNAAIENIDEIRDFLSKNTKMVFVTAGMGGGTGTGAAPVIAAIAKELNILTVGIVTVPFGFEGRKRRIQAEEGLEAIRQSVDTLLIINNEKLREISGNLTIGNAFAQADDVLSTAAKGIADVISATGSINVDFNDVNTVMKDSGVAIMGSAQAEGEDRALVAVQEALNSPLLNDNEIAGAKYVLLNITYGDKEVLMDEITEITDFIQDEAGDTADVIWGHGHDETLGDKLSVTIIATGFNSHPITGFEAAPERKVHKLEDETKKEIVQPMNSPTAQAPAVERKNVQAQIEAEPFMKSEAEETVLNQNPIQEKTPTQENQEEEIFMKSEEQKSMNFEWEMNAQNAQPAPAEKKVYQLDDEEEVLPTDSTEPVRIQERSPEEQNRLNQERMNRIQEFTRKLKNPNGLNEFEKEPAFMRRNIQLDQSAPSQNENISRFGLNDDENGTTLRGNNSFLHDNVD